MEGTKSTNKRSTSEIVLPRKKNKPLETDAGLFTGISKTRLKTLVLPPRKKNAPVLDMKSLDPEEAAKKEGYECPLCADIIYPPYPPKLKRLIKKIRENDRQYEKEMRRAYNKQVELDRAEGKPSMPFAFEPAGISLNDKKLICRTHRIELIYKPMALKKGYPTSIDFEAIPSRVNTMEDDLKKIVDRTYPSAYLDAAMKRYKDLGLKARRADEVMKKFEDFLPGYYGNKGSDAIMNVLNKTMLQSKYVNLKNASPLTPIEFIQQILVPECGLRLIQQDREHKITLQEAKIIMKESEEYGSIVHRQVLKLKDEEEKQFNEKQLNKEEHQLEQESSNE